MGSGEHQEWCLQLQFRDHHETYNARINVLFSSLDRLEHHLAQPRFGKSITETDIRLFTALIRFDNTLPCAVA
jgi:glutathionyl-hydroquinone reductase